MAKWWNRVSLAVSIGDRMQREYHRWWSPSLGRDMELLRFGHDGPATIVFPTSMGAFFEYEDRGMVAALAPKIDAGQLQLICISTVDSESFYAKSMHPRARIERYLAFERYLLDELVPFVRQATGRHTMGVTGCSFGAYHAFTMALRHPDVFTSCIAMGGAFDIQRFLDGYYDDDCYFLCPPDFLPGLSDGWFLERFRQNKWVLIAGDKDICRPDTERAARLLADKSVPRSLHIWTDSEHDWPEWTKMAAAYLP
jgi:esterase/lipase superfamily enzyme